MNLFTILKHYATRWNEKDIRNFTEEEIKAVAKTEIVASQYGNSVCFYMVDGGQCYIPCDSSCTKGIGESIDLNTAKVKTLEKKGEKDILRILA